MTAWHFLKHLNCITLVADSPVAAAAATTLSRCLVASSPLNRLFSSVPFLSNHNKLRHQWPTHIHAAYANFSTASSSSTPATYVSVFIHCPKDSADVLAESLLCFGASSVTMDQQDVCQSTDEICISSIFGEGKDINMSISHAADSIGLKEIPRYEVQVNEEDDWIKGAQESFRPTEIIEGLWAVPKWSTPPDVEAANIILSPGLAFGTGEHPATKLCLILLHGCIKGGEYVLDYGTGTGILAIAALKFGAAFAVGVDIDSQAIASASENAVLNNIGADKFQLHLIASQTSSSSMDNKDKYDVVVANILLNPLLDLSDQIVSCAKPGAVVGLSGILCEQVQYIIERYSPFLEGVEVSRMDEWACVSGRKK